MPRFSFVIRPLFRVVKAFPKGFVDFRSAAHYNKEKELPERRPPSMLSADAILQRMQHKIPVFSYDTIDSTSEAARRFMQENDC